MPLLTNALLLATSRWTDLGVGPLTVSSHGPEWANVVLALSDTQPPATLSDGEPLRGSRFFGSATHVWGLALGQPVPIVVTAPDVGAALSGGGGTSSGGATTIADGADTAQGTTTDAAWSGTGAATLLAVAKAVWTRLGSVVLAGGTALVGKVGIDQTTPGTTNKVSIGSDGSVALGAAVPSGEAHIGEVGGNVARFLGQFGPSASTTYTAGQTLAAAIEVTGMSRVANGSGFVTGASLELAALNTVEVDLVFFSSLPSGTYTAGSTFAIAAADRAKVSKVLKLTDWTALGTADSVGEVVPAPKFFVCEDTTKTSSLWTVPVARGSITLASATDATLKIRAARN